MQERLIDVQRMIRQVEKATCQRDFAREEVLQQKMRAKDLGTQFALLLGSKTDQVHRYE